MLRIETSTKMATGCFDASGNPTADTGAAPAPLERTVATVTFDSLPADADGLRRYESHLADRETGRFVLFGLLAATFRAYDAALPRGCNGTVYEMMGYLFDSPYAVNGAKTPFGAFDKQFIDDRMRQSDKHLYQGDVYWNGATHANGYTPALPHSMTVEDYVYSCPQPATATTPEYYTVACYGSDWRPDGSGSFSSPQLLSVTYSDAGGRWYLCPLGYSWHKLLSDASVKAPDRTGAW